MGFNTDELELASDFQPIEGEANFPPTITREVVGGAHIAPHCITIEGDEYVLADWAHGLPRHDVAGERAIRFPHGLISFGESFEKCADRLVADQLGLDVVRMQVIHVYSSVDSSRHWHIEPLLLTWVSGDAKPPSDVTIIRHPIGPTLPEHGTWRGKPQFALTYEQFIKERI